MTKRMTKRSLLESFINGATKGKGSNLIIKDNELINYNTVIAKREGNKILLNNRKYSKTTTVNQNIIRQITPKNILQEIPF